MPKLLDDLKENFEKHKSMYYVLGGLVTVSLGGFLVWKSSTAQKIDVISHSSDVTTTTPTKKTKKVQTTSDIENWNFESLGFSFTLPLSYKVESSTRVMPMIGKTVFVIEIKDGSNQASFTFERVGNNFTAEELFRSVHDQITLHAGKDHGVKVSDTKVAGFDCKEITMTNHTNYISTLMYEELFLLTSSNNRDFVKKILTTVKISGTKSTGSVEFHSEKGFRVNLTPIFMKGSFHSDVKPGTILSFDNKGIKLVVSESAKSEPSGLKETEMMIGKTKSSCFVNEKTGSATYFGSINGVDLRFILESTNGNAVPLLAQLVGTLEPCKVKSSGITYRNKVVQIDVPLTCHFCEPVSDLNEDLVHFTSPLSNCVFITRVEQLEIEKALSESKDSIEKSITANDDDEIEITSSKFVEINGFKTLQIKFITRPGLVAREMGLELSSIPTLMTVFERNKVRYRVVSEWISEKHISEEDRLVGEKLHQTFSSFA